MYHSCGSNFKLMEYFIEAGVDILNPIQTTAANMDPVRVKSGLAAGFVWGGGVVDTQTVLPHGTADEVREQAQETNSHSRAGRRPGLRGGSRHPVRGSAAKHPRHGGHGVRTWTISDSVGFAAQNVP